MLGSGHEAKENLEVTDRRRHAKNISSLGVALRLLRGAWREPSRTNQVRLTIERADFMFPDEFTSASPPLLNCQSRLPRSS